MKGSLHWIGAFIFGSIVAYGCPDQYKMEPFPFIDPENASLKNHFEISSFPDEKVSQALNAPVRFVSFNSILYGLLYGGNGTNCDYSLAKAYDDLLHDSTKDNKEKDRAIETKIAKDVEDFCQNVTIQYGAYCTKCKKGYPISVKAEEIQRKRERLQHVLLADGYRGSVQDVVALICIFQKNVKFVFVRTVLPATGFVVCEKNTDTVGIVLSENYFDRASDVPLAISLTHEMMHVVHILSGTFAARKFCTYQHPFIRELYQLDHDSITFQPTKEAHEDGQSLCDLFHQSSDLYKMWISWYSPEEAWNIIGWSEVDGILYKNRLCDNAHWVFFEKKKSNFHPHFLHQLNFFTDFSQEAMFQFCRDSLNRLNVFPTQKIFEQATKGFLCYSMEPDVRKVYFSTKSVCKETRKSFIENDFSKKPFYQQALQESSLTEADKQLFQKKRFPCFIF